MASEDVQSVAILDVHGKMMEWNGDDYVVQGSGAEAVNKDDAERDSDQYLVNIMKTIFDLNEYIECDFRNQMTAQFDGIGIITLTPQVARQMFL